MRDVILAAAGEAADTTSMPARESGHAEPRDDMTAQLTQVRTAGEAEGVKQGSTSERARIHFTSVRFEPSAARKITRRPSVSGGGTAHEPASCGSCSHARPCDGRSGGPFRDRKATSRL